jgi:hypothetical protein
MRKFQTLSVTAGLLAVCMVAVGAGQGDIYRWKDPSGNWHYADQPVPGAELVRGTRKPPPAPAPVPAPVATPAASASGANEATAPVSAQVADQVRQEAATAKIEQCKQAEERYTRAVQARRIYKTDEKGNKVFLNDAELDAARLNARAERDLSCSP